MKKDARAPLFKFPTDSLHSAFEQPRKELDIGTFFNENRCTRILQERSVASKYTATRRSKTPLNQPTSPLRVINHESSISNSPVPIETTAPTPGKDWYVAKPKPEKNGLRFESPITHDSTQEDQEIEAINQQGDQLRNTDLLTNSNYHCDSVLKEFHPPHNEDFEECEQQQGSSCTSGGLHMPNSHSMFHLVKAVNNRYRYHSQCNAGPSFDDDGK